MGNAEQRMVVFTGPEQAELKVYPTDAQPLAAGEISGRTIVSMISPGTEIYGSYVEGESNYPSFPGYAAVFQVEAVGSEVTQFKAGDLCFCTGPHGTGGHRLYQRIKQEAALKLPEGLAPEVAVHARLMGVSMTTLTTTLARPAEKVLILGLGPVGHLAAQLFNACGYCVIAVDPVVGRRQLLESKGLKQVFAQVPFERKEVISNVALALDCSGHEQAVLDACKVIRKRGEVVMVGVPRKRKTDLYAFEIMYALFRNYGTLRSGWEWEIPRYDTDWRHGSVFSNLAAALQWLQEGRVKVDGLYETVHPQDCQQVYQRFLKGTSSCLSALFDWRKL